MLAAAAGLQQYKQSAILYALLAAKARPRPFSAIVTTDVVSLTPEQLSAEAEALLERCGEKVRPPSPASCVSSAAPESRHRRKHNHGRAQRRHD